MKMPLTILLAGLGLLSILNPQLSTLRAQGSSLNSYTFQGRLNDANGPANGLYDFSFALFPASTGGSQIGTSVARTFLPVTNGLFTVPLEFLAADSFSGADRWLEIAVHPSGVGTNITLGPRQQITAAPYAIRAANLAGTLPLAQLPAGVVTNGAGGVVLSGDFTGNGAGVTNVNAALLGGLAAESFWKTTGNAGANPTNGAFLGTTDNLPAEFRVNGARALRLEPTARPETVNVIGGSSLNFVGAGVAGATIGGGGSGNYSGAAYTNRVESDFGTVSGGAENTIESSASYTTVGGGRLNVIEEGAWNATIGGGLQNLIQFGSQYGTIGGGDGNRIQDGNSSTTIGGGFGNTIRDSGSFDTIGGGADNTIESFHYASTISGGNFNRIQNTSEFATIGGGYANTNQANSSFATVPGGRENSATSYAFAAGRRAKANHTGAFIWADSTDADFSSTANDQLLIRAAGGVGINTNNPNGAALAVNGNVTINGTLGTLGSQPLQFNVNGQRVLYLESNPNGSPNVLSGSPSNRITAGLEGATIAGGGIGLFPNTITASYATIGGGTWNTASGGWATIGGGRDNGVAGDYSTLLGGRLNRIQTNATYGAIGGGYQNTIQTNADYATIGGGFLNTILTNADRATIGGGDQNLAGGTYATVPGGVGNQALGQFSLAAGHDARALHDGAFVWADSPGGGFSSTANNQFCIQARGGLQIDPLTSQYFGSQPRQMLNLFGTSYGIGVQSSSLYFRCDNAAGTDGFIWYKGGVHDGGYAQPGAGGVELMHLVAGGLYVNGAIVLTSDRNAKENFKPVSPREVLDKVAWLPISRWNYREDKASEHLGPMAQDFRAAFGLGPDDKHITTVDADGVALAAIQGLNEKVEGRMKDEEVFRRGLEEKLQQKEAEITELQRRLEKLERLISATTGGAK